MQIILVQAEVEQAIQNYINDRVRVPEGTEIIIDLAATRGPEGFKATVDLVPADQADAHKAAAQEAQFVSVATANKTLNIKGAVEKAKSTPKADKVETVPTPSPVTQAPANEAGTKEESPMLVETVNASSDEQDINPDAPDEDVKPVPPRSLFANLKKPVNS